MMVLFAHIPHLGPWENFLRDLCVRGLGGPGVKLFFVFSGFLVAGLLFRERLSSGFISPWHFLIRRGFKIYPQYYLLLGLAFLPAPYALGTTEAKEILSFAVFIQNYGPHPVAGWGHLWSLAVEEHFYFLLAVGLAWLMRPGREDVTLERAVSALVFTAAVTLAWRSVLAWSEWETSQPWWVFFPTHLNFDALLLGVLLAYLYHYHPRSWARLGLAAGPLMAVALLLMAFSAFLAARYPRISAAVGHALSCLASGGLLVGALEHRLLYDARLKSLAYLGACSYSIYLWHIPVKVWTGRALEALAGGQTPSYGLQATSYLAGSLLMGVAMTELMEKPFLRLRDKLFPSRSGAPLVAGRGAA
jgi:peptidoglycan/LPS O-acetylase OafA/YrhL